MKKYLLISILFFLIYNIGWTQDAISKEELLQELATHPKQDTTRLSLLYQAITITYQNPEEQIVYIDQLLQDAEKQKNSYYICLAYWHYIVQAYNRYDAEEINKWVTKLEPLARKEKLYDLLFRGKQAVIDMLLIQEQYELEEKEAKLMLQEAQKLENIIGQISAYHSLAHVYRLTYRGKMAFEVLEKAISLGPQSSNQSLYNEVLRTMTIICEDQKDFDNWYKYLQIQENLINQLEKQYPSESFKGERILNNISYLKYYIDKDNANEATKCMQLIEQNYSDQFSTVYKYNYFIAKNNYYFYIKNWEDALKNTDQLLILVKSISELEYVIRLITKARILVEIGNEKEALDIYKEAKILKDSLSVKTINKQAEQLKNSYKSDLLVLDRATLHQQIQQIFLILSGIIILILCASIFHAYKTKRKLIEAEREMKQMMEETDQANKIKERFLSNINMTIRPSLNVIVDNSSRLATEDNLNEAEKIQLSATVSETSEKLMELINEILILSKLEAGMMKFTIQELDINQFVKNFADTFNQVKTTKIHIDILEQSTYQINADEKYLKQILTNLCESPAKNDKEITLQIRKEGETKIEITCSNTILASSNASQEVTIQNEINRMIISNFGGNYQINTQGYMPQITITFNILNSTSPI